MDEFEQHPRYRLMVGRNGTVIGPSGKALKARPTNCGYVRVAVYTHGRQQQLLIHRLVAETFMSGGEGEVNHLNGNKADNRAENLEWCTRSENARHAIRTGLRDPSKSARTLVVRKAVAGEKNGRAKLTDDQIRAIRSAPPTTYGSSPWTEFGISNVMYRNIRTGKNWSHVK